MSSFKDNRGDEWLVRLDGPKIREVRETCDFNLAKLDGKLYEALSTDHALLVDILWVLCRGQRPAVTDEEFAERLFGDPIEHATDALIEAVTLSFPARKRSLLRSLTKTQAALMDKGLTMAQAKIDDPTLQTAILKNMEAAMDEALAKILTGPTGAMNSQAKSASVPMA